MLEVSDAVDSSTLLQSVASPSSGNCWQVKRSAINEHDKWFNCSRTCVAQCSGGRMPVDVPVVTMMVGCDVVYDLEGGSMLWNGNLAEKTASWTLGGLAPRWTAGTKK